jgi:hypothetical protein
MLSNIWHAWTVLVKNTREYQEFVKMPEPEPEDDGSVDSHQTSSRRIALGLRPRLPGKAQQETPSRGSKRPRTGQGNDDGVWLDDETLRELDSEEPKATWMRKQASIVGWAKVVSDAGERERDVDMMDRHEGLEKTYATTNPHIEKTMDAVVGPAYVHGAV